MSIIDAAAVAGRLAALREHYQLNQADFADSVGIDKSSYSKIENCKKPLKAEMALAIADRWGVTLDYIYRGRLTDLPPALASALIAKRTTRQR